jgi:hopanoid biosynthesis associated radical SAM protein HpnH
MRFPIQLTFSVMRHLIKNKLRGRKRFPLVMMLEPLHLCNLACDGCGRIREYESTIREMMSLEDCLARVEECDAPIVSVCGGEPLIYPHIVELVEGILARKRHLMICTNGIGLEKFLPRFRPTPYFTINVSMDGLAKTHDLTRGRKGLYELDMRSIRAAKDQGFRVVTNTTVYRETDVEELETLFEELSAVGVDGMLVSPGYHYQAVQDDIFLRKMEIHEKFKLIEKLARKYRLANSPLYLKYLAGDRHYDCTPWGNPTVNPQGWKGPCYLITDQHYKTYQDLMDQTDWEKYEKRNDERCVNCMMHSSVEPTVMRESGKNFRDTLTMIKWNFS